MELHQSIHGDLSEQNIEAEAALIVRLEALEQIVFGHVKPVYNKASHLREKVDAVAKQVTRAEGGNRELRDVAQQASTLGLLADSMAVTSAVEASTIKENILLASRGEIEEIAGLLAKVKELERHVNPPYLRDIPRLSEKLTRMEGNYVGQVADTAMIDERAENINLHYSQAIALVSEKFVHWDDQVAKLERMRPSNDGVS